MLMPFFKDNKVVVRNDSCLNLLKYNWMNTGAPVRMARQQFNGTHFIGNCGIPVAHTMTKSGSFKNSVCDQHSTLSHYDFKHEKAGESPRLDIILFLKNFRNKHVMFVGDSMSGQQAMSLRCSIGAYTTNLSLSIPK